MLSVSICLSEENNTSFKCRSGLKDQISSTIKTSSRVLIHLKNEIWRLYCSFWLRVLLPSFSTAPHKQSYSHYPSENTTNFAPLGRMRNTTASLQPRMTNANAAALLKWSKMMEKRASVARPDPSVISRQNAASSCISL